MNLPVTVAILAAGASRRLGHPKQLIEIEGEPLIRRQCRVASETKLGEVVVVLGSGAEDCSNAIANLPIHRRLNDVWNEGLASSIREATRAALASDSAGLLLVQCDQFRITPEDLLALHTKWANANRVKSCRATHGDYAGPPVLFPATCFPDLLKLKGDEGAKKVLAAIGRENVIDVEMPSAAFDLDLPEQLEQIAWLKPPQSVSQS